MGYDPARVALALLAVAVVALSTTLFPAAGLGSYPAADRGGGAADTVPVTATPAAATPTPQDSTDDATATPTVTPTATPTASPVPASDPPGGGWVADGIAELLTAVLALLVVGGVGAVLVTAGGMAAERTDLPPGRVPRVRLAVRAVPQATMAVLVGTGSTAAAVAGTLGSVAGGLASGVGSTVGSLCSGGGRALSLAGSGLGSLSLPSPSLSGLLGGLGPTPGGRSRRPTDDARGGSDDGGRSAVTDAATEPAPPETVHEAWRRLRDAVPGDGKSAWTPGYLARRAVDRGYPADAVATLTRAFRRTRYGGWPADEHRERALDAYDRLRGATADGDPAQAPADGDDPADGDATEDGGDGG